VWVKAPVGRYIAAMRNIEEFEKGENFRVTKKVSSPPRLEDFAQLVLPADDIEDLKRCRVGSCELKLSESSLNRTISGPRSNCASSCRTPHAATASGSPA
jgi:hypothetical protein